MLSSKQKEVLQYLKSQPLHKSKINTITIAAGKYAFCGNTPQENISILVTLEELGYIRLKFYGHTVSYSMCDITLLNSALNEEV